MSEKEPKSYQDQLNECIANLAQFYGKLRDKKKELREEDTQEKIKEHQKKELEHN